jgi:uncharacterized membrane protein
VVRFARAHFGRHARFYVALVLGIIVWATTGTLVHQLRLIAAADTFFGVYLVLMTILVVRTTPDELRKLAAVEDEGIILIVFIALAASCFSLGSIFTLLNQQKPSVVQLVLTLASAPLGWFMLHTIAALHYAHLYYARTASGCLSRDTGGLKFPGTDEPHPWDFIYHSFVIGMTTQVSDVMVLTTPMRQLTLAQAIISFFFNTVLIALAVNVAVVLGQ